MTENEFGKKNIDVAYIAQLARLELDPSSVDRFQKDMENIVEYVDLLGELDLKNVEPTAHPVASNNVWREDNIEESYAQQTMLKNAPAAIDEELIQVPQVILGEEDA